MAVDSPHGTRERYRSGCTCRDCRKANSNYALSLWDHSPEARHKRAEAVRRSRQRNPEAHQQTRKAYDASARGRAKKAQYREQRQGGALTESGAEYAEVLFGDPCSYCGGSAGEIDHIHPIARGGTGEVMNLTSSCRTCNARKYTKSLLHFLLE